MTLETYAFTSHGQVHTEESEEFLISDDTTVKAMMRVFDLLSRYDTDWTIQRAQVLWMVFLAGPEGALVQDIEKRTGLNRSSVVRSLGHLSDNSRYGRTPLGWVEARDDPENTKRLRYHLTAEGKRIKSQIEGLG